MINKLIISKQSRAVASIVAIFLCSLSAALAHPLGNFTINHFAHIRVGADQVSLRYIVDMAEIPTFQELRHVDTDNDGAHSSSELDSYAASKAAEYGDGLFLSIDGLRRDLRLVSKRISMPGGAGGLPTLRVELDYAARVATGLAQAARQLRFESTNYRDRPGWREIVVTCETGVAIFNSTAFGNGVTDELKTYPEDLLDAPLEERAASFSFARGSIPEGGVAPMTRDGRVTIQQRDRMAELIAVPELNFGAALLGLLIAALLGSVHALSPGHGKTIVGAYLVGSRGTARHAAFLGLTVTVTHTIGIFALGLVTLFASQYVLPDRLLPILSLVSGSIILVIGLRLFLRRLRIALRSPALAHSHDHSHFPPGADDSPVTWRGLLALGISGGLLPCPSALVVLLSAISLNRVGYGLLLVIAFSLGLAATLTAVGLLFLYAGRFLKQRASSTLLTRILPATSALIITCIGAVITFEALSRAGINPTALFSMFGLFTGPMPEANSISTVSALTFGLALGLRHAVEADHLAAVAAIASEKKGLIRSSLVGGLWGVGHTLSLFIMGLAVLLLRVQISERTEMILELLVAIMLIGLGANAILKLTRGGKVHAHAHEHGNHSHAHLHMHDNEKEDGPRTHHALRLNARPVLVGMMHGLAGSAALMLLVLSTIESPLVGLAYVLVFGIGSILGMSITSALLSLPVYFADGRFTGANLAFRMVAGIFSLGFGLLMIYQIGFVDGLFI
jgi:ABC-type nickel/cobalt efflux system permease component RcnA